MMSVDGIRGAWLKEWRGAAKADGGDWLCALLGASKDEIGQRVDDMVSLITTIPIEGIDEDDDDYDANYILHWQRYGIDANSEDLVALYFEGERRAVIFAQLDSISELPLKDFIDTSSASTVAIELPRHSRDFDEMSTAIEFFEEGLGLQADLSEGESRLPWNGDDTRAVLELNDPWTVEVLAEAAGVDAYDDDDDY